MLAGNNVYIEAAMVAEEPHFGVQAAEHSYCTLCGYGNNTVQHWLTFCPVVLGAVSYLTGEVADQSSFTPLAGPEQQITALHTLHQAKRMLHAKRAINWVEGVGRAARLGFSEGVPIEGRQDKNLSQMHHEPMLERTLR